MPEKPDLASELIRLMGAKNALDFSRKFGVSTSTLTDWKYGRIGAGAGFLLRTLVDILRGTERCKEPEKDNPAPFGKDETPEQLEMLGRFDDVASGKISANAIFVKENSKTKRLKVAEKQKVK
jgi:hypothetical protein